MLREAKAIEAATLLACKLSEHQHVATNMTNSEVAGYAARACPQRPPFVFDWNDRRRVPGYRNYQGYRNTLVYVKEIGQRFKNQFPINQTTHQMEGEFTLFSDAENSRHYLAFRDTEGGIREGVHGVKHGP